MAIEPPDDSDKQDSTSTHRGVTDRVSEGGVRISRLRCRLHLGRGVKRTHIIAFDWAAAAAAGHRVQIMKQQHFNQANTRRNCSGVVMGRDRVALRDGA